MTPDTIALLERCRAAEKEQALFYRSLGAQAEEAGDEALAERFHDLHADEQHQVSRLTARLVELGVRPADLSVVRPPRPVLEGWEAVARPREAGEMARWEALLAHELDGATRALVAESLEVERRHHEELGGKWTPA